MKKKVIIIGAGPAGLSTAYELNKSDDFDITILELEKFVGGISRTAYYNGNRMDVGGHRFFTKVDRVSDLWHEIMPLQGAPSLDDILLERKVDLVEGGPNPELVDEAHVVDRMAGTGTLRVRLSGPPGAVLIFR